MHAQDALFWQDVVQQREDGFLELSGVPRAADEDEFAGEVEDDEHFGTGVIALWIGGESRRVNQVPGRLEGGQSGGVLLADEHVAGEETVPRHLGDYPHRQPEMRIGAGVEILNEDVATVQVG